MFERKDKIYITDDEQSIMAQALIDMKNELHRQGRYTDCVDDLLIKVISVKKKKVRV